jgi:hypothetical protein
MTIPFSPFLCLSNILNASPYKILKLEMEDEQYGINILVAT